MGENEGGDHGVMVCVMLETPQFLTECATRQTKLGPLYPVNPLTAGSVGGASDARSTGAVEILRRL